MFEFFLKRRALWLGFLAVLVPLLILLALQFIWLGHLRRVTAIAHEAALHTFLESVGTDIQYFYRSGAERALNIPAALIVQGRFDKVAHQWKAKPVEGARRLFLADFTRERFGNFLVYDPATKTLETPAASEESLAIILATTPWQLMRFRGPAMQPSSLMVDERNTEHRIILNPILDESSEVVGVTGMILDEDFFRKELLPAVVKKALPKFFPGASPDYVAVTVRNPKGAVVFALGDPGGKSEAVSKKIPFVFADWAMTLNSTGNMPERLAATGFAFNLTLAALLGAGPHRRDRLHPAGGQPGREALGDEVGLRLQRLPRAENASGLHPGLRGAAAPRAGAIAGEGPGVRGVHRGGEPPPLRAHQQHPGLRPDRIGPEELHRSPPPTWERWWRQRSRASRSAWRPPGSGSRSRDRPSRSPRWRSIPMPSARRSTTSWTTP